MTGSKTRPATLGVTTYVPPVGRFVKLYVPLAALVVVAVAEPVSVNVTPGSRLLMPVRTVPEIVTGGGAAATVVVAAAVLLAAAGSLTTLVTVAVLVFAPIEAWRTTTVRTTAAADRQDAEVEGHRAARGRAAPVVHERGPRGQRVGERGGPRRKDRARAVGHRQRVRHVLVEAGGIGRVGVRDREVGLELGELRRVAVGVGGRGGHELGAGHRHRDDHGERAHCRCRWSWCRRCRGMSGPRRGWWRRPRRSRRTRRGRSGQPRCSACPGWSCCRRSTPRW